MDNVVLAHGANYTHKNYAEKLIGKMSFDYFLNDGGFSNKYLTNFDLVNSILFSRGFVNSRLKESTNTIQKYGSMIEEYARNEKNQAKLSQLDNVYK